MKKTLIIVIILLLLASGSWPAAAETKPKLTAGNKISADSPLYFMDRTAENIVYFFAGNQRKVKLRFLHAQERLIEAKELLEKEKIEKANKLFKEAVNEFTSGVKLAAEQTVESQEVQKLKQEAKTTLNKLKKLMIKGQLKDFTNNIKDIFGSK